MAKLHKAGLAAQLQDLPEQAREGRQMPLAELANRAEVRMLHPRHRRKIQPLLAASSDPPRRVDTLTVRIKQQRHHHARMIGRKAALPVVAIHDRRQVQTGPNRVADKVGHVPGRHQILDRRRQQPNLINVPWTKCFAHPPFESRHLFFVEKNPITRTGS
jgi:hypothetical protein